MALPDWGKKLGDLVGPVAGEEKCDVVGVGWERGEGCGRFGRTDSGRGTICGVVSILDGGACVT